MVSGFEVRITCPSTSFLFVQLGGSLGVFPHFENFVFKGNSLSVALDDLLSLLRQSIDWFESWVREREIMSEVRSSELETGLSSSGDPVKGDIAVSTSREVKVWRCVIWMLKHWVDLRIDFNSQSELGFVCLIRRIGPITSSPGRYAFASLLSSVG